MSTNQQFSQKLVLLFLYFLRHSLHSLYVAVKLDVVVLPSNGHFEIMDGSQLVASGFIFIVEHDHPFDNSGINKIHFSDIAEQIELNAEDIYKEFLLRGYEYGQAFRYQTLSGNFCTPL